MKGFRLGRIMAIAAVIALGIAGSVYVGYWSKMGGYIASIVNPSSVQIPARAHGGEAVHGGPQSTGFNAGLLPKITGYATVLGLFAALVRLVDLLRKRKLAARSVEARLAAGPAAGAAALVAGAVGRETP